MTKFAAYCDRLYSALSARECLAVGAGEPGLNRRGERLLCYLRHRRFRKDCQYWARESGWPDDFYMAITALAMRNGTSARQGQDRNGLGAKPAGPILTNWRK